MQVTSFKSAQHLTAQVSSHSQVLFLSDTSANHGSAQLRRLIFTKFPSLSYKLITIYFSQPVSLLTESPHKLIVVTCPSAFVLLRKLLPEIPPGSLDDFVGNLFEHSGKRYLILPSIEQLTTTREGEFLYTHFINKLINADSLPAAPSFTYSRFTSDKHAELLHFAQTSPLMSVDIETLGRDFRIDIVGLAVYTDTSLTNAMMLIYDFSDLDQIRACREALASPPAKVTHNGMFDMLYLLTYQIAPYRWTLDTMGMMHALYAELPKNLAFCSSFFLRNATYWKSLSSTNGDYYNALDVVNTLAIAKVWLERAPAWAQRNFAIKFPEVFPALQSCLQGIKVCRATLNKLDLAARKDSGDSVNFLRKATRNPKFNINSPKQLTAFINSVRLPGTAEFKSADKESLDRLAYQGPIQTAVVDRIRKGRKADKLRSNYIESILLSDRLYYSLNPWGTETGRHSCNASSFSFIEAIGKSGRPQWANIGCQLQNIPGKFKTCLRADTGFKLVEFDGAQAESRYTAYLAQEPALQDAVENSPDFHSKNASAFFGVPFDAIWDTATAKAINKELRDLSKRVNHGSTYNMAKRVLAATMGEANLWKANKLLSLGYTTLDQITSYLLLAFCRAYPRLKGVSYMQAINNRRGGEAIDLLMSPSEPNWYAEIIREIESTGKLTGPTGWTRRCFGKPRFNKSDLNAYVAHGPQSLQVMVLNEGMVKIWSKFLPHHASNLQFLGQIHDSLLFQYREGHEYLLPQIAELLHRPVVIHNKTMHVPFTAPETGSVFWK